jgi:hypothetical protein|tara:strand:+ start:121 stop:447 length:327 start_codon:yes stop_codon:yes gene_type:complete
MLIKFNWHDLKLIRHDGDPGELDWAPRRWYGHETDLFHPWYLDNLDKQKTLWGKIKCALVLEYNFHFTPRTSIPKCPTPISTIKWWIWHKFIYKDPDEEAFKNYKRWE